MGSKVEFCGPSHSLEAIEPKVANTVLDPYVSVSVPHGPLSKPSCKKILLVFQKMPEQAHKHKYGDKKTVHNGYWFCRLRFN